MQRNRSRKEWFYNPQKAREVQGHCHDAFFRQISGKFSCVFQHLVHADVFVVTSVVQLLLGEVHETHQCIFHTQWHLHHRACTVGRSAGNVFAGQIFHPHIGLFILENHLPMLRIHGVHGLHFGRHLVRRQSGCFQVLQTPILSKQGGLLRVFQRIFQFLLIGVQTAGHNFNFCLDIFHDRSHTTGKHRHQRKSAPADADPNFA
mmetsp:Transcript_40243/g.66368  ORF Transcript_40243/g.66368 Transcript_40243/m.66368 type:complete len:204 (+) Transcript_40243:397-1008(+)